MTAPDTAIVSSGSAYAPSSARALANPAAGGVIGRLLGGVKAVFSGFGIVLTDGRLFGLSLIPMVLHVLLLGGLLWVGFSMVAGPLIDWLGPDATAAADAADAAKGAAAAAETSLAADVGKAVWSVAINVLVGALIVVVSLMLSLLLGTVICDPFYDLISERTEAIFLGRDVGDPFTLAGVLQGIVRELMATLLRLSIYAVVAIPLWLVSFTPVAVVATPLAMVWTWFFVAYEFLSRSLARHAVDPSKRVRPFVRHKALFLGFGSLSWLLGFIPLSAPVLVVGATRLYLALAAHDEVPSRLSDADKALLRGA